MEKLGQGAERVKAMGVVVFSKYFETGKEADTFDVGHTSILDGMDGFFDQSFEVFEPGDKLFFLVTDGRLRVASERAVRDPYRFRDSLTRAVMVSAVPKGRSNLTIRWVARGPPSGSRGGSAPIRQPAQSAGEHPRWCSAAARTDTAGCWRASRWEIGSGPCLAHRLPDRLVPTLGRLTFGSSTHR